MIRPHPVLFVALALMLPGCGSETARSDRGPAAVLLAADHGRLVDVYGTREVAGRDVLQLYRRDVVIGYSDTAASESIRQIGVDPESLQPRMLIPHPVASARFAAELTRLTAARIPIDRGATVPRNAAIRLAFDRELGLDDDFFATRGASGGARNTTAVQIAITNGNDESAEVVPMRISARGRELILDPVLIDLEAESLQLPARPLGLPASEITLALALEGPASIPGLAQRSQIASPGRNASGLRSLVLSFRSGGWSDVAGPGHSGFAFDDSAPGILGFLQFYLERVDDIDPQTQEITLYKAGISHDIDQGDVVRVFVDNSGVPAAVLDIIADPDDDNGMPAVQHVRALVPHTPGLKAIDPRNKPGYPQNPQSPQGQAWLIANAPRAVLSAEFTAERRAPSGQVYGDDLRHFVVFTPEPLPLAGGASSPANENISPHAQAILRFTEPIDFATIRPLDTLFFATRDLLDPAQILQFVQQRGIDPQLFSEPKYRTPHLVHARKFDLGGSQTAVLLQPPLGFYLDEAMRIADQGKPFAQKRFKYHLHIVSGPHGIRNPAGVPLDLHTGLTGASHVVLPFSLDTRKDSTATPLFADNLAVSVVRRYVTGDEDEQPSYYRSGEVQSAGTPFNPKAFPLPDLFGSVIYLPIGSIQGRPNARVRKVVDDINQAPPPPQSSLLRFCPEQIGGQQQFARASASVRFGAGLVNPMNPFGCRLQSVWREIDLSLSRLDPFDFNLEVEQMYWGPFTGQPILADSFPRTSLFLGHGERRPEPCVGTFSALPSFPSSGLQLEFADNYVANLDTSGNKQSSPALHPAYVDAQFVVDPNNVVTEPNGINRYVPLPDFQEPYFVWRDERVAEQGGNSRVGSDVRNANQSYRPYIISPSLQGQGRWVTADPAGSPRFNHGFWGNTENFSMANPTQLDPFTNGAVGSIALPLLADLWIYPKAADADLDPTLLQARNGWQISLSVSSSPRPDFRAFSGGGLLATGTPIIVDPTTSAWQRAIGGLSPNGTRTMPSDNSVYWTMVDFLMRRSVATAGFVDLFDPHRMPNATVDPRLGPYAGGVLGPNRTVRFAYEFDLPPGGVPAGGGLEVEFRGAGAVDAAPWRAVQEQYPTSPDAENFPLDPLKATDAHIRKYDDRPVGGIPRDYWTYLYNRNITDYTDDPADLMDASFLSSFAGPNETFTPADVRYFNWRFVLRNGPSGAPTIDSFAVSYRIEAR